MVLGHSSDGKSQGHVKSKVESGLFIIFGGGSKVRGRGQMKVRVKDG